MPAEQPKEDLTQKETEKEPVTEISNEPKMENYAQREDVAEPLVRKRTPITAEWGVKIRKLPRKDGLFKVRDLKNQAVSYTVNLNAKTCTCPYFTHRGKKCKHIEVAENIGEIRYHKIRKYDKEYHQNCYRSNPEYREGRLEASRRRYSELREEYKRFKIEYGGKCTVCGNDNIEVLVPHHPHRKEEKGGSSFIHTKEFRDWVRFGIKPDVVLMCANCHLELERIISRRKRGVSLTI